MPTEPATIREHLGSASMHLAVLTQNLVEDSDDWFTAHEAWRHVEAVGAILDASTRELRRWGPDLALVADPVCPASSTEGANE